jgi:hypothetical protein
LVLDKTFIRPLPSIRINFMKPLVKQMKATTKVHLNEKVKIRHERTTYVLGNTQMK